MRLTLRTLLAWLDGVLPTEEQRQLGEKVAANHVASQLSDRIRAVVGRSAIGAPRVDGRGLTEDPNSVAEYLDNTLLHDQLEAFERICLESDVHLAEVASCHGLLAEAARDASLKNTLDEQRRRVLQQLARDLLAGLHDGEAGRAPHTTATTDGPHVQHDDAREMARAIRAAMHPATGASGKASAGAGVPTGRGPEPVDAPAAAAAAEQPVVTPHAPTAPRSAPRRSSSAAWAAAGLALLLLVTLAGLLTWSIVRGGGRRPANPREQVVQQVAQLDIAEPSAAGADAAVPIPAADAASPPATDAARPAGAAAPPADDAVAANVPPAAEAMAAAAVPPVAQAAGEQVASAAPPAAADQPAAQPAVAAAAMLPAAQPPAGTPPPDAVAAAATATAAAGPPAGAPAAQPGSPPAVAPLGFVGGEGVLLRLVNANTWTHAPAGSSLQNREDLLVPPGFFPELHVRGVTIRLFPDTRAALSLDDDGTPRIEVVFGRAVARASRDDARLGVTAAGLVGSVDRGLLEPVAVQVERDRAVGSDPATAPPRVRAELVTGSGGVVWRQTAAGGRPVAAALAGIGEQGLLEQRATLAWDSAASDRVAVTRGRAPPAWVDASARPDRLEKSACETLAAKVAATTPLTKALRELAVDKRAENRMLAAATLAIVGEFDELVELLCADSPGRMLEPRQWAKLESQTVPLALVRGPQAAARLRESFGNRGPHGKADLLWSMARGVSQGDLSAGADRVLVEALEDGDLVVRRYASKTLNEITQAAAVDRLRYRPDGLPDQRREGVLWWRNQLERGLIRRSQNSLPGVGSIADVASPPATAPLVDEDGDPADPPDPSDPPDPPDPPDRD